MATVPVIVGFGNSNWHGFGPLANVPAASFSKWFGVSKPSGTYPYTAVAPGVRILVPRMPYAPDAVAANAITGSAANSVTSSTNFVGTNDQWVYVATNTTGQGQHRRITAGIGTATVNVAPNWTIVPALDGTAQILGGSHTVAAGTTTTRINKTATTAAFTSSDVGKWLVVIHGSAAGQARKISAQNSATQVDVDTPFTVAPAANDGICVLGGSGAVNSLSDLTSSNCALRDLQFFYDSAYPYRTGWDLPNIISYPLAGPAIHKSFQYSNIVPELSWQFRAKFPTKINVVSLGVSATTMAPQYVGTSLLPAVYSWMHDITHLDYHPASPTGLYTALVQSISAACDLITAEGNRPDVVGVFSVIAENDGNNADFAAAFLENMRLIRSSLRKFIFDSGYCARKAHEIPFLTTNVKKTSVTYDDEIIAALDSFKGDDSRTDIIDVSDIKFVDAIHFDSTEDGAIEVAKRFYEAWKAIYEADNKADRTLSNLPTLASIRTLVRRRYERNATSNDHSTSQIDMFINDSLREVVNTIGDNAWFVRRVETATLDSGAFPATIVLDAQINRLLRIESSAYPGRALVWKGINHTSNLRTQITLHETAPGPYLVHFIQLVRDLVDDTDIASVPMQYIELVVMLTCKRLSECGGNANMSTYYAAETERLWRYVKRDCLRYDRMRQESMMTQDSYSSIHNFPSMDDLYRL